MAKATWIELANSERIPILYEDGSALAIDKPAGWILAPERECQISLNLHAAIMAGIAARDFWARSRNLRYLRYVHRLDAETTGVLLLAKSPGALGAFSRLFESRQVEKVYLAVVAGMPVKKEWSCCEKLSPDPRQRDRVVIDPLRGKAAATSFSIIAVQ